MKKRSKRKWVIIYSLLSIACLIIVIAPFLLRTFIVQAFKLPSGAMQPTLLIGDHILVDKRPGTGKDVKRGDIIVFPYPVDPKKDFVKRVVGLPGELIEIRDKEIYINEQILQEDYVIHTDPNIFPAGSKHRDNFGPIEVPPNSLFVMGDNRDASFDSRYWGFVDAATVTGMVIKIYWSWDKKESRIRWERIGNTVK